MNEEINVKIPTYGTCITLNEDVQYIGEGEDPKLDFGFNLWEEALKKCHHDKLEEFKKEVLKSHELL